MAAPTTDPKIAIILDFIAGGVPGNPSGESAGNYNAVIGQPHASQSLAGMRLDGIFILQHQALGRGMPSDAIGRYQFIGPTLRNLVAQAKLPLTTLFTPDLQDRLATVLLRGRGYGHWATGPFSPPQISDAQFAHGLSCEWASLPDPFNGGRSHYDGLAGNHASCTLGAVYAMLEQARPGAKPQTFPAKVA
jgi:muramidase (phage lysozyme)